MDSKNLYTYEKFILNEANNEDTPEAYIKTKLVKIKRVIENMFEKEGSDIEGVSFKDLNLNLQSSTLSKRTMTHQNLIVKFYDNEFYYNLLIRINLTEAYKNNNDEETEEGEETTTKKKFSIKGIEECYIKFRKYEIDGFKLIGIVDKNVKIEDINEDFIISLKIEMDEKFSSEEDSIGIEFEEGDED